MNRNVLVTAVIGGGLCWLFIFWVLFGFPTIFQPATTQDEFNVILNEDMQLLCTDDGKLLAQNMGLTFDEAALDVWCKTPIPPAIEVVDL